MKKFANFLTSFLLLAELISGTAMGQNTGEICIIGQNSSFPDKVLIVPLVDIPANTVIYFSNNDWKGSTSEFSTLEREEGYDSYTTPASTLAKGTVIEIDFYNNTATTGTVATEKGNLDITYGDQLYMYLGTSYLIPTTFIFATSTIGYWLEDYLRNTGLTSGQDALIFPKGTNNMKYTGTRTGTVDALKAAIADESSNWTTNRWPYTFETTAFTITGSGQATPITLASFTAEAISGVVELAWETPSETNNAQFVIYRNDAVLATVEGAGTTSETNNYVYVDATVVPVVEYTYVLADVDYSNEETKYEADAVTVTLGNEVLEADFTIGAAYPNPFNPTAIVPLTLSRDAVVNAKVYTLTGREIATLVNESMSAGSHELRINANDMTTGLYLVKVIVDNVVDVQKIAFVK